MPLINTASLSQTIDAISASRFDGRALTLPERSRAARWIAARQGLPRAYGQTFAGFPGAIHDIRQAPAGTGDSDAQRSLATRT